MPNKYLLEEICQAIEGVILYNNKNLIENFSINSKEISKNTLFFAIKGKYKDGHEYIKEAILSGATVIVLSNKSFLKKNLKQYISNISIIIVKDTLIALHKLSKYLRNKFNNALYIGLTGSSGKTTTKEMINFILSKKKKVLSTYKNQNNHIGVPLTLLKLNKNYEIVLIEMGTNSPGEIKTLCEIVKPNYGIITNIGNSHLDQLKSIKGVLNEKIKLAKSLNKQAVFFLNKDDENLVKSKKEIKSKIITYGINEKADYNASDIKIDIFSSSYKLNKKINVSLKTSGIHNIYNSLCAIAVSDFILNDLEFCAKHISKFLPVDSRFNVYKINNVNIINDTYNANPLSFNSALDFLNKIRKKFNRLIIFAGDMLELGKDKEKFHFELGEKIAELCPNNLFIIGKYSKKVLKGFNKNKSSDVNIVCNKDVDELLNNIDFIPEKNDLIFFKASRSVKMEKVVEAIELRIKNKRQKIKDRK